MTAETSATRRLLVLVVDDFLDNREMYAEYLGYKGFDVLEAASGGEAVELAIAHRPDVILMDLSLPGMDGWEATRRLKADERTRRAAIIALSGHVLPTHTISALEAGCDDFLAKPCLPDALVTSIQQTIAKRRAKEAS